MDITVDLLVSKPKKKVNFSEYNKLEVNTFECTIGTLAVVDSSDEKSELVVKLTAPVKNATIFKSLLDNCEDLVLKSEKKSEKYKIEKIIFVV